MLTYTSWEGIHLWDVLEEDWIFLYLYATAHKLYPTTAM
jgi:hypothetical protein